MTRVLFRFALMTLPLVLGALWIYSGAAEAGFKQMAAERAKQGGDESSMPAYVFLGLFLAFFALFALGLFLYALRWLEDAISIASGAGDRTGLRVPGIKFVLMIFKSMQRNMLRTSLMYLAIFVLVMVITWIWAVLSFLNQITGEKAQVEKSIITEKYQVPSMMPYSYLSDITGDVTSLPPGMRGDESDVMTWSFVIGTLDPKNRTFENSFFCLAMDPKVLLKRNGKPPMMDGIGDLSEADYALLEKGVAAMELNDRGVIVGRELLKRLDKKPGDRIVGTLINYQDDFGNMLQGEVDILAEFPPDGRLDQLAIMHVDYLTRAMDAYRSRTGRPHPMLGKMINLVWVRLPTREAFAELSKKLETGRYSAPAVKMETASSGFGSWFDAYRDLIWGMKWLMGPAIIAVMALVISNAISISVRERRTEMAVLKVLGFRPWMVMTLVMGESVLIGGLSGFLSGAVAYYSVYAQGGFAFGAVFFPMFFIPADALWWGPLLGVGTALAGSSLPAWTARSVKVSEVFSKVG